MSLNKVLQSITGMSTPDVQNLQQGSQQDALQLQANQPQYMQQEQQNIGESLGIPQLQGQYGNFDQLFQLYLHDNSMAQKYGTSTGGTGSMNPYADPQLLAASLSGGQQLQKGNQSDQQAISQMTTPNQPVIAEANTGNGQISGTPTASQVTNPYLGSSQSILDSVANAPQAPSLTTAQMAQPLNAGRNLLSLLNTLLGAEQGIQSQKLDLAGQNYKGILDAITSAAGLAGQEIQNRRTDSQNAVNMPGTMQQAGAVFQSIIDQLHKDKGNQVTENDIWNYINQHDAALRAQGVNVDELWKLHKDLADKVGIGGNLEGGKETSLQAKQQATEGTKIAALKGFGHLMDSFYKEKYSLPGNLGGIDFLGPTAKEYNAQKDIYTRQLGAALKASKATKTADAFAANLPGGVTLNAEGSFKGHLSQVLDANQLKLFKDKSGNIGIVDFPSFDPNKDTEISVDDLSVDEIRKLLNQL